MQQIEPNRRPFGGFQCFSEVLETPSLDMQPKVPSLRLWAANFTLKTSNKIIFDLPASVCSTIFSAFLAANPLNKRTLLLILGNNLSYWPHRNVIFLITTKFWHFTKFLASFVYLVGILSADDGWHKTLFSDTKLPSIIFLAKKLRHNKPNDAAHSWTVIKPEFKPPFFVKNVGSPLSSLLTSRSNLRWNRIAE